MITFKNLHIEMTKEKIMETTVGSIFAISLIQPQELLGAFVVGGAGAIGAFVLGGIFKWIVKLAKEKLKKLFNKKNETT